MYIGNFMQALDMIVCQYLIKYIGNFVQKFEFKKYIFYVKNVKFCMPQMEWNIEIGHRTCIIFKKLSELMHW